MLCVENDPNAFAHILAAPKQKKHTEKYFMRAFQFQLATRGNGKDKIGTTIQGKMYN